MAARRDIKDASWLRPRVVPPLNCSALDCHRFPRPEHLFAVIERQLDRTFLH
jgi:hypothetical protein